jgi:hypothetical protein
MADDELMQEDRTEGRRFHRESVSESDAPVEERTRR